MGFVRDTALLTWRSLRAIPRVPERLLDVTIQPIVFILLFLYVFGSAIHVPGVNYKDFMFPGIIGQSLAFGIIGAGVATSNDMTEGVIDRFRSMPISRLSIITGQVMGQFCEQVLGMVIVVGFGLALGWSPHLTFVHGIELVGLMVLGRRAVRDARSLARRDAGGRLHRDLPAQLPGRHLRAHRRDGRHPAGDRPVGSDLGAGGQCAGSHHPRRPCRRLVAARPPPGGDGPVVRDHPGRLRPARPEAV
jgi:hypothetical protein